MAARRLITLDNVNEPWAQQSEYVLTSPRSLKACAMHDLEPAAIVSRTFQQFRRFYDGTSLSEAELRARHAADEARRRDRLAVVRAERQRLIALEDVAATARARSASSMPSSSSRTRSPSPGRALSLSTSSSSVASAARLWSPTSPHARLGPPPPVSTLRGQPVATPYLPKPAEPVLAVSRPRTAPSTKAPSRVATPSSGDGRGQRSLFGSASSLGLSASELSQLLRASDEDVERLIAQRRPQERARSLSLSQSQSLGAAVPRTVDPPAPASARSIDIRPSPWSDDNEDEEAHWDNAFVDEGPVSATRESRHRVAEPPRSQRGSPGPRPRSPSAASRARSSSPTSSTVVGHRAAAVQAQYADMLRTAEEKFAHGMEEDARRAADRVARERERERQVRERREQMLAAERAGEVRVEEKVHEREERLRREQYERETRQREADLRREQTSQERAAAAQARLSASLRREERAMVRADETVEERRQRAAAALAEEAAAREAGLARVDAERAALQAERAERWRATEEVISVHNEMRSALRQRQQELARIRQAERARLPA
jgi:hypothetical protein